MTPKENALHIIRFGRPECVVAGPPCHGIGFFGVNHEAADGVSHTGPIGCCWTDIWGTVWKKEQEGMMGFPVSFPLAKREALASYRWPDTTNDEHLLAPIYSGAKALGERQVFLGGSHRNALWERACQLVGMETLMERFFTDPSYIRDLFHHIMDFHLGIAAHYLKLGVEMIFCSDDLGTQLGPLIGPDMLRDFFVPEYRRLFGLYHEHRVLINFHSCGNVEQVVPIFLDLGIHIINPVQATANHLDALRQQTAGRLVLQGGISSKTLMDGPPEAIVAEVRQRLWQLGRDGGYFCGPDQHMPFPPGHLEAMNEAIQQHGRYPIGEDAASAD